MTRPACSICGTEHTSHYEVGGGGDLNIGPACYCKHIAYLRAELARYEEKNAEIVAKDREWRERRDAEAGR